MDNSNIIISVIIVLCIAAGVTAYGISEGDNAVFSDLTGFSPADSPSGDNGIGNNSTDGGDGSSISTGATGTTTGSGSTGASSGSGGSGSTGVSSNGGSGSGNGNGNNNNNNNNNNPAPSNKISSSQASSIASQFIEEEGAYIGSVVDTGSDYACHIYDANGNWVDTIIISYAGENLGKG